MVPVATTVEMVRGARSVAASVTTPVTTPVAAPTAAPAGVNVAALPACAAGDLTLSFDGENGTFDGMQHGGTLMVVRNVGAEPCRVAALPRIVFAGADGKALPIRFDPPPGLHPGPVVPPVGIAPGAEVTAELRWVAADAYPGGRCSRTTTIEVSFGTATVGGPFAEQFCGPGAGATFGQTLLKPDAQLR